MAHNSRMKLMVSLAAQSVLLPLCLRRLPTAYANVRLAERGATRSSVSVVLRLGVETERYDSRSRKVSSPRDQGGLLVTWERRPDCCPSFRTCQSRANPPRAQ